MHPPVPPYPTARCGTCVHRNAPRDAPRAYCAPAGWRGAQDWPCQQWFGYDQLHQAVQGRRP